MKEGETLNLTCSLESFPPSVVTLTKSSENNVLNRTETNGISSEQQNKTLPDLQNEAVNSTREGSGMATYFKSNVTVEDSGQYVCTAKHLNDTLMTTFDVNVICKYKVEIIAFLVYFPVLYKFIPWLSVAGSRAQ